MNTFTISILATITILCVSTVHSVQDTPSTFTCTASCPSQADNVITGAEAELGDDRIDELINTTKANVKAINQLRKTLKDLQKKSYTSSGVLNNVLLFVEELVSLNKITSASPLPKSCQEIQRRMPTSPSGVYLIATSEKKTKYVYCHMDTLCGSDGGWTRLANIDMTDPAENCPSELRLYDVNEVRACGRPVTGSGSCPSIQYPSNGIQYNQVCGRARGYQYYSTDAVAWQRSDINSYYVDGVSVTRGSPRQHIWTFMAGLKEDNSYGDGTYTCPCQTGSTQLDDIPSFINNDYYCESGNPAQPSGFAPVLYTDDPLWDGYKCRGLESDCCKSSLPWFHKQLNTTTNDSIEVRICSDQGTDNEDTAIEQLEIFVK